MLTFENTGKADNTVLCIFLATSKSEVNKQKTQFLLKDLGGFLQRKTRPQRKEAFSTSKHGFADADDAPDASGRSSPNTLSAFTRATWRCSGFLQTAPSPPCQRLSAWMLGAPGSHLYGGDNRGLESTVSSALRGAWHRNCSSLSSECYSTPTLDPCPARIGTFSPGRGIHTLQPSGRRWPPSVPEDASLGHSLAPPALQW